MTTEYLLLAIWIALCMVAAVVVGNSDTIDGFGTGLRAFLVLFFGSGVLALLVKWAVSLSGAAFTWVMAYSTSGH